MVWTHSLLSKKLFILVCVFPFFIENLQFRHFFFSNSSGVMVCWVNAWISGIISFKASFTILCRCNNRFPTNCSETIVTSKLVLQLVAVKSIISKWLGFKFSSLVLTSALVKDIFFCLYQISRRESDKNKGKIIKLNTTKWDYCIARKYRSEVYELIVKKIIKKW